MGFGLPKPILDQHEATAKELVALINPRLTNEVEFQMATTVLAEALDGAYYAGNKEAA